LRGFALGLGKPALKAFKEDIDKGLAEVRAKAAERKDPKPPEEDKPKDDKSKDDEPNRNPPAPPGSPGPPGPPTPPTPSNPLFTMLRAAGVSVFSYLTESYWSLYDIDKAGGSKAITSAFAQREQFWNDAYALAPTEAEKKIVLDLEIEEHAKTLASWYFPRAIAGVSLFALWGFWEWSSWIS
jgi:hypothetical protein